MDFIYTAPIKKKNDSFCSQTVECLFHEAYVKNLPPINKTTRYFYKNRARVAYCERQASMPCLILLRYSRWRLRSQITTI